MSTMRRALVMSLVLHLVGLVLASAAVRPRFRVPPRLQVIPVDFVALAAPAPARTVAARSTSGSQASEPVRPTPAKPAEASPGRPQPPPRREPTPRPDMPREAPRREPESRPSPKSTPASRPGRPPSSDLPRRGSADTTQVMHSELPQIGDRRGALQMRVEGDVPPYAYYLSLVQGKIAGFWEPPAGIQQQPGEVAAVVWFRIEKDGTVRSEYVEEPSGIGVFDDSVLQALTRALPLPPLPEDYPGDHVIVHLRFVWAPQTGLPAGSP